MAPDSTTTCTASNTGGDATWSGAKASGGGSVSLTSPAKANIYAYTITCNTGVSPNVVTETATAYLFDGVPIPTPTDCGVTNAAGVTIPTLDLLTPDAVVTTHTDGICLFCSVSQPENVVDQDPTDYAIINRPVAVAGTESLTVTNTNTDPSVTPYAAGHLVGFVASNPAELLTLELLKGVTVNTFLKGVPADTAGATVSSVLHLDLLTLLANPKSAFVGFIATQPFDAVQIASSGLVSAVAQTNVYQACVSTGLVSSSSSSSSSGGSSSSSSSSGGSSSSGSSSSGSSSSSSGSTATAAPVSISVSPNPVVAGGAFTLTYTGPGISSNSSCVATNTAKDSNWNKVVTDAGNSVSLTAPTTPNVYSYSLTCSVPTGGSSTASASLYVGLPAPIATDCGALKADGTALPTLSLTDANASVATGSGGLCLFCSVSQPQNVLNQDPTNFAVLNTPVGLFANESVTVTNNTKFTAGHTAGFIASQPGELLTLALLKQLSVTTLLHGAVQETAGGTQSLPLHLDLLTLLSNPTASFVSFKTTKDFDGLQLVDGGLLSALEQVNVYQACVSTP
ncbi:MAG: hypothetical protein JWR07_5366 [Nevskia sp.]|nr:hypothetical protein [Nevskia sp.]